ncbi:MAG: hypothetical protein LBT76_01090, partial [Tannerella sp.]|nr:hypothetical protein [Tannerella sp.]
MKKYVWLLLTFPCLLSAQVPNEEGIEKTLIRRLHALQTGKGAVLRSEATEHLPDSTYTYYDGKLHRAAGFQYNEADWVTLEQGYTDFNLDGLVDEGLKSVYTYTRQGDLLVQEVFTYIDHSHSGAFAEFSRIVNRYDANEMDVDSYEYYPDGYGGWEVHEALVTVEWNERGLPSVLVDSIPGGNGLRAQARFELSYDGQNQPVLVMILVPGASGAWTPYQRIESTYGYGGTPRIDTYFELNGQGAWTSFYFIETRFDEHGNRIYEADHKLGEDGEYHIKGTVVTYRHVYPSGGETAIDGIA